MLVEVVHDLGRDRDLQRDRRQRVVLVRPDLLAELPERDVEDLRELADLGVAARASRQAGRPDDDRRRRDVADDHAAVPVDDRPPGRLDGVAPQLVLDRRGAVLVGREDLQRPEPEEEDAERDERDAAEDGHAHRHPRCEEVRLLDLGIRREEARQLARRASQRRSPPGRTSSRPGGAAAAAARSRRPATWRGDSARATARASRRGLPARAPARRA